MNPKKAAVIDMGTNTFHLLLVELHENSFKTIYKEKIAVRLGQGGISKKIIAADAMKRAFHTLEHFSNLIKGEGVKEIFAFATSAVRNAENGDEFVISIKKRFGIHVNVINGTEEAHMIYEGIRFSESLDENTSLMMDIGGGSVEFIIGNKTDAFWKQSFEIGGQRMLDLFHYHDPILPEETAKLNIYLEDKLRDLIQAIHHYGPNQLVGASGTFDTLSDIYFADLNVKKSKSEKVFHLPTKEFEIIAAKLTSLDKQGRLDLPGMIPMRVDMIVVASLLISYILKFVPATELVCSNYALKEGAIAQLIKRNQVVDSFD
ncbi:Ppx/GppA phosphatase family protein [Anditalea andensis]|uniref:Exopolyphosphatase n=1 Tax=Anditalea andensis TaxID=1048983 RepID=A0A074KYD7_9BACT|nr:exopolyphosphatase [Anditalea andensis]KEO75006.1 exopolyphosphatase [Anditalea andensis]